MTRIRSTLALTCVAAVAAPVVAAAPAQARPLERERVHYSFTFDDACGDVAMEVTISGSQNVLFVERGPSGLPHFNGTFQETGVYTNLETGLTYTVVTHAADRDFRVLDNGDGTLTIVVHSAGVDKWYDADGKLLYIDSGTGQYELLVDNAGTPDYPFDDGEAEFVGVLRELTGKTDTFDRDFCADFLEVTS